MAEFQPTILNLYQSAHAAHLAKSVLESHGIRASITGDQLADALSVYGSAVAKVELYVDASQLDEAVRILQEHEHASSTQPDRWGIPGALHWRCENCDESNGPAFDQCWNCSAARPAEAEWIEVEPTPTETDGTGFIPEDSRPAADSPYRPPQAISEPAADHSTTQDDPGRDLADRALRAGIFGLFAPIPIAFYGCYLCAQAWHSSEKRGRTIVATALNVPAAVVGTLIFLAGLVNALRRF